MSERRVCRVLGQHRSTQRKVPCGADDEQALTDDVVALAKQYGRYGYRRVTALLHAAGWSVNHKRVERIWRREGLKVPQRQPKRGRLWLNDGSCIRLRPEYPGHVWAYDFVEERTHDGRKFRILTIIDEASRECLALVVSRQLRHEDVLAALADLFVERGPPAHITPPLDRLVIRRLGFVAFRPQRILLAALLSLKIGTFALCGLYPCPGCGIGLAVPFHRFL